MGAVWLGKITNDQPIWETDSARAGAAVFLLQTGFFVTYPSDFTFLPQCDCKPQSNNALISVIIVFFGLKRQSELQESPLALPSSTFSIMPPYRFYPLSPLPRTLSPAQLVSFPPCSTDLPL